EEEDVKRPTVYRAGHLPPELPAWFAELDTDKDGQVSLAEWRRAGKKIEEFQLYDRNDDGYLTAEEMMRQPHLLVKVGPKGLPGESLADSPGVQEMMRNGGGPPPMMKKGFDPQQRQGNYGKGDMEGKKGKKKKGGG